MLRLAIIEDSAIDKNQIISFLNKYSSEKNQQFSYDCFENAITFLTDYKPKYDLIFIDIQIPHMNGMEAAERLRRLDTVTPIVFITNMANYAVKGYSVNAIDFIIKPLQYPVFCAMMNKALRVLAVAAEPIAVKTKEGFVRIFPNSIYYVDINTHLINYYTENGRFSTWGSLRQQEEKLPKDLFIRANNYCVVNLKFVKEIKDNCIIMHDDAIISISRSRKKVFMEAFVTYCGKYI